MYKSRAVRRLLTVTKNGRSMHVPRVSLSGIKYFSLFSIPIVQPSITKRNFMTSPFHYATQTTPPEDGSSAGKGPMSEEKWIAVLENTASASWLNILPLDHADRLKRAYTLLFQIVLYLGRPHEPEMAEQFLVAFGTAPTPPESEIGRARKAVAIITRAVVRDISSVPLNSPLRTEQAEVFNIFGALQALHDMYLMDGGDVDNWPEFWNRAQPVVLSLGMKLDEVGFGLNLDEFETAEKKKDEEGDKPT